MTVHSSTALEDLTGAASPHEQDWHTIHWYAAERLVHRLQTRIVKATQEGRWGKVKALQRLLTHSFSGKALAVKRVTENAGKRTPGVDGQTWKTSDQKVQAIAALRQRGYRPRPLRRMYIAKRNGKLRPLGIPTMLDRAMQALYLLALDPVAEVQADQHSYGFRHQRSPADAIAQCFIVLSNRYAPGWILEGDIRACFDEIAHEWLLAHIPMDTSMLRAWLKAGFLEDGQWYPPRNGTPQGSPVSPVLANLTLDGLEQALRVRCPQSHSKSTTKVNLVRFADDFLITGDSYELLEQEVKPLVEAFLQQRGLTLSPEKTLITHIDQGVNFLGQHLRKFRGKLLITPSKQNVHTFLDKVRTLINANKQATAGNLISQLNPLIRGWARYHRHVVSAYTFAAVDAALFHAIWHWAKRRHPKRSAAWVRQKYFRSLPGRAWTFVGEVIDATGAPSPVWLFSARQMPIRRHIKVRKDANPYDPAWEEYFEERWRRHAFSEGRKYRILWGEQHGKCLVCRQPLTTTTGWHTHHVVWRSHGGPDVLENLVLLHPNCHRQVHSQHITVTKPRPSTGVGEA